MKILCVDLKMTTSQGRTLEVGTTHTVNVGSARTVNVGARATSSSWPARP
ncbi:MAG: hypothetical protein R3F60_04655 [bacterium]